MGEGVGGKTSSSSSSSSASLSTVEPTDMSASGIRRLAADRSITFAMALLANDAFRTIVAPVTVTVDIPESLLDSPNPADRYVSSVSSSSSCSLLTCTRPYCSGAADNVEESTGLVAGADCDLSDGGCRCTIPRISSHRGVTGPLVGAGARSSSGMSLSGVAGIGLCGAT